MPTTPLARILLPITTPIILGMLIEFWSINLFQYSPTVDAIAGSTPAIIFWVAFLSIHVMLAIKWWRTHPG